MAFTFKAAKDLALKPWDLLMDIWWRICTKEGNILFADIPRFGADGRQDGVTSLALEGGYSKENNSHLRWRIGQVQETQKAQQQQLDRIEGLLKGGKP